MNIAYTVIGTIIETCEWFVDWCKNYHRGKDIINFIETNRKEIVYSFDEVDIKKVDSIAISFFLNKYYRIILTTEDDYTKRFYSIVKCMKELPNFNTAPRKYEKQYILSAAAVDSEGESMNITTLMNELSGPKGDFYKFANFDFPKDCLLGYISQLSDRDFTYLSYIDFLGDTHVVQQKQ